MNEAIKATESAEESLAAFYALASSAVRPGRDVKERVRNFDRTSIRDAIWLWWDLYWLNRWAAKHWYELPYEIRLSARDMVKLHRIEVPTFFTLRDRFVAPFRVPRKYFRHLIKEAIGNAIASNLIHTFEPLIAQDDRRAAEAWGRIEARAPDFANRVRAKPRSAFNPDLSVDADEGDW